MVDCFLRNIGEYFVNPLGNAAEHRQKRFNLAVIQRGGVLESHIGNSVGFVCAVQLAEFLLRQIQCFFRAGNTVRLMSAEFAVFAGNQLAFALIRQRRSGLNIRIAPPDSLLNGTGVGRHIVHPRLYDGKRDLPDVIHP